MRLELNRRKFLQLVGKTAAVISVGALTGCGDEAGAMPPNGDAASSRKDPISGNPSSSSGSSSSEANSESDSKKNDDSETLGIIWKYKTAGSGTATLCGYDPNGVIPSGYVELPEKVDDYQIVEISSHAFEKELWTGVVVPKSVKKIGNDVFHGCAQLKNAVLENGVEEIGDRAFCDSAIEEIELPSSAQTIGDSAFALCEQLGKITLNNGLRKIGYGAFAGTNITEIEVPDSVEL